MKTISKALIAVMVAAAMCLVPLFAVADDSDAIDVTAGEAGISFKAGSISDDNFKKLTGGDAKEEIYAEYASSVLNAVIEDGYKFNVDGSTVKISNVKDVKIALGTKITSDSYATTNGREITFDIEFKATAYSGGDLFDLYDGTQTLYKELGKTNRFAATNTVEFKGTATISEMMSSDYKIAKTYSNYYVATEGTMKMSTFASFEGDVTFNNGTTYKITIDKAETGMSADSSFEFDFYGVDTTNLTSESKYIKTTDGESSATDVLKYKINDKSDGYDFSYNSKDVPTSLTRKTYTVGEVGDLLVPYLFTTNLSVPEYLYYDGSLVPSESTSFFNQFSVSDSALKDNTKMKEFLDDIGSVGDTYSSAESVSDSAYESVGASGSGNGGNIVFYIIIGVLAVAVVALAVLMIKKK